MPKLRIMKRSELFFSFLQVPVDFVMIVLAGISAFAVRNIPQVLSELPKLYNFPFDKFLKVVLLVAPFFIAIYALEGLYDIRATRKFSKELRKVFTATSIGLVIIIVAIFLKREWFSSRFIILAGWMIAVFYVSFARYLLQSAQKWLLVKKGIGVHRVLLIGGNSKLYEIRKILKKKPILGYKVVDQIEDINLRKIKEIKKLKGIDEIILCDPSTADDLQEKTIDYCAINNIAYRYIPTTLQTSKFEVRMLDGEPLLEVQNTPLEGWGKIIKKIFDVASSTLLIILSLPLMLLVAIIIKLEDSSGPVIYKNERVGNDGKKFFVYKFRYLKAEHCISRENPNFKKALEYEKKLIKEKNSRTGPTYKIKNDPRKTRIGTFIEKYSIDELPQFFNVLKGDMSMVGPRPHQEREVEKYREYHRRLLTIKPGITGMAQISGRSDLDFEEEYRRDVFYIENWSLWLDISICVKTVGVLFRRRKNL